MTVMIASTRVVLAFVASSVLFSVVQFKAFYAQYLTYNVGRADIDAGVDAFTRSFSALEPNSASSPHQSLRTNGAAPSQVTPATEKTIEEPSATEDATRAFSIAFDDASENLSEEDHARAVFSSAELITETPIVSEDSPPRVAARSENLSEIVSEDPAHASPATKIFTGTPNAIEDPLHQITDDSQESNEIISEDQVESPSMEEVTETSTIIQDSPLEATDSSEEPPEAVSEDYDTLAAAEDESTDNYVTETSTIIQDFPSEAADSWEEPPEAVSEDYHPFAVAEDESTDDYDRKRAIVLISTGAKAAGTKLVERFVWSARNLANYRGWIVLITDAEEERYADLEVAAMPTNANHTNDVLRTNTTNIISSDGDMNDKNRFLVFRTQEERFANITNFKPFRVLTMNSKVYKTYILEYASLEPRLDEIQLFYYLDVDIVFGNPIERLFTKLESKYKIGKLFKKGSENKPNITSADWESQKRPTMHFFKGNDKNRIQGGQFILDRSNSQPCLERWRKLMQSSRKKKYQQDQDTLTKMLDEQKTRKNWGERDCEIVRMKQDKALIQFPELTDIIRKPSSASKYPVLVHFRNSAKVMKKIKEKEFDRYLRGLLRLENGQEDEFGLLGKMLMDKSPKKPDPPRKKKSPSLPGNETTQTGVQFDNNSTVTTTQAIVQLDNSTTENTQAVL